MKQAITYLWLTLLLFAAGMTGAAAQTGAWTPAGASYGFPRTLLKASELPSVRQSLTDSAIYILYSGVYANGTSGVPAANTSSNERRLRAQVAKNAAFVLLLNRKPAGSYQTDTLTAAQRSQLELDLRTLLENINTAVSSQFSYTDWQWRSKELIDYLIAYDLMRGAGVAEASLAASRTRLQQFATNLYTEATKSFFGATFFNSYKNNHALMTAAALGMAAVVLNDATGTTAQQAQSWLNAGLYHLDNVLWRDAARQSEPGKVAGYFEGPYYFKYAFLNCLPFIRAIGHFLPDGSVSCNWNGTTRSIRNPWYDPNYDNLYSWASSIMMPDGRLPALEDSYIDMGMPELALTGKPQYLRKMEFSRFEPGQMASLQAQLADVTVDMRAAFIAANVQPATPAAGPSLTDLRESGNLIFRSGGQSTDNYLHLYGKNGRPLTNSGGHNHADAGSFILHAHGQLLALDPGYLNYNRRGEVGNAYNHNMILVDGAGPAIGTAGAANDAAAYIQNTFFTPELAYGEVATAYRGANILRKALTVRNKYYILADAVSTAQASQAHQYTWQLHGYGLENGTAAEGTFTDGFSSQKGTWQKNGVSLLAHVTATDGASSYQKSTSIHELTYNTTQNHTVMQVHKNSVLQTEFLSVLYPYVGQAPVVSTVAASGASATELQDGDFADVAFAKADTLLKAVQTSVLASALVSDAAFTFYSASATTPARQFFLQQGTTLRLGAQELIRSSRRADVAWQQTAGGTATGYVSRATTLAVPAAAAPLSVNGSGIQSWQYDAAQQEFFIVFTGPSAFSAELGTATPPLPVELIAFEARRSSTGAALSWSTASELNNYGFEVQRSGNGRDFAAVGFVNGRGTRSSRTDYSFTDATAPAELVYYRLQQLDHDGTASFSPVVAVAARPAAAAAVKVWPVPAQEVLHVQDEQQLYHRLQLQTPEGRLLLEQPLQGRISLPVQHLKPGLYLLQLHSTDPQVKPLVQKVLISR